MSTGTNGIEGARVHQCQGILLPRSPQEVCESIGLNWWAAKKLHTERWLSFDPEAVRELDERQECELRFVGALVCAGCDEAMLRRLLAPLAQPFCYRPNWTFYDWIARAWKLLPKPLDGAAEVFSAWIDALEEEQDVSTLEDIQERAANAIKRIAEGE